MKTLTLIPDTGELDALVDRIVDGDTFGIQLFVPLKIRLNGVQVAEKNTEKGKRVIQVLKDRLTKQIVTLTLHGRDKYGRMLANVRMSDNRDLSEWLVGQGLAVEWDGKGPRPFGQDGPPEVCGTCEPEEDQP